MAARERISELTAGPVRWEAPVLLGDTGGQLVDLIQVVVRRALDSRWRLLLRLHMKRLKALVGGRGEQHLWVSWRQSANDVVCMLCVCRQPR